MDLKTSALLALIGTLLIMILTLADFINVLTGIIRDVVPAMALLRSLIYLFASITVTLFFLAFHKSQSR